MSFNDLCARYENEQENAYQSTFDETDADLREQAVDELTAEQLARVPLWVRWHFEFLGEDLEKVAREYVESDDKLVNERVGEMR